MDNKKSRKRRLTVEEKNDIRKLAKELNFETLNELSKKREQINENIFLFKLVNEKDFLESEEIKLKEIDNQIEQLKLKIDYQLKTHLLKII